MMPRESDPHVRPLCPRRLGNEQLYLALGVQAGPWVFANGHLAINDDGMPLAAIFDTNHPRRGKPHHQMEAEAIFAGLGTVLDEGGSGFHDVVRLDQYYTTWRAVPHYHVARHQAFEGSGAVPASTSILMDGLLLPEAAIESSAIAYRPGPDEEIRIYRPDGLEVSPLMGFAPAVRAGDYVFLSGQMAEAHNDGIADAAKVPESHLWKGLAIKLEADYVLENRLVPALRAAGSSVDNVVKAQVYISNVDDIPAFNQVWARWFPKGPPATTIIPTARPGFNCPDAHTEINLMAVADDGAVRREEIVAPDVVMPFEGHTPAVRAGNLLLVGGLMAVDENGLVPTAKIDPRTPYFLDGAEAQMDRILDMAEALCESAGTSLSNIVRIQQFHTDLDDFLPACRAWRRRLGDLPLPLSAIRFPAPSAVPGCTILTDIWVYVP